MEFAIANAIKLQAVTTEMLDAFLATAQHEAHDWLGNRYMCLFFDEAIEHANFRVLSWLKTNRLKNTVNYHETVFRTSISYRNARVLDWLTDENPQTATWPWHTVMMALRTSKPDYYLWYHKRTPIPEKIERFLHIPAIQFSPITYDRLTELGLTPKLLAVMLLSAFRTGSPFLITKLTCNVSSARKIALANGGKLLRQVGKRKIKKMIIFLQLTRSDCASIGFAWPI